MNSSVLELDVDRVSFVVGLSDVADDFVSFSGESVVEIFDAFVGFPVVVVGTVGL